MNYGDIILGLNKVWFKFNKFRFCIVTIKLDSLKQVAQKTTAKTCKQLHFKQKMSLTSAGLIYLHTEPAFSS